VRLSCLLASCSERKNPAVAQGNSIRVGSIFENSSDSVSFARIESQGGTA